MKVGDAEPSARTQRVQVHIPVDSGSSEEEEDHPLKHRSRTSHRAGGPRIQPPTPGVEKKDKSSPQHRGKNKVGEREKRRNDGKDSSPHKQAKPSDEQKGHSSRGHTGASGFGNKPSRSLPPLFDRSKKPSAKPASSDAVPESPYLARKDREKLTAVLQKAFVWRDNYDFHYPDAVSMNIPHHSEVVSSSSRPSYAGDYALNTFACTSVPYVRNELKKNCLGFLRDKCMDLLELGQALHVIHEDFAQCGVEVAVPEGNPPGIEEARMSILSDQCLRQFADNRREVKDLIAENSGLIAEKKTLNEALELANSKEADLQKALADAAKREQDLQAMLNNVTGAADGLRKELSAAHEEVDDLRKNVAHLNKSYLQRFLGSQAFVHAAINGCTGLMRSECYEVYLDVAQAYPVLDEDLGLADVDPADRQVKTEFFHGCYWNEDLDRLVDPHGNCVIGKFERMAISPKGIRHPFPSRKWPKDFPRPAPGAPKEDK